MSLPMESPSKLPLPAPLQDLFRRCISHRGARVYAGCYSWPMTTPCPERDGIWLLSPEMMLQADLHDSTLLAINPAWTRVLGWDENHLRGTKFFDLVHPDDLQKARELAACSPAFSPIVPLEIRCRHRDDGYRNISWTVFADAEYWYASGRESIGGDDKIPSGNAASYEEQKLEAVGQLAAVIAHDFNNLLQGISGSLELTRKLTEMGRAGDAEKFINNAMSSLRRVTVLTQHLFDFSSRDPIEPKPVALNELIASLESTLRLSTSASVTLDLAWSAEPWTVVCDPDQLKSAIIALVRMARDSMPAGGRIVVATSNVHMTAEDSRLNSLAPGDYMRIAVTDTGKGYPEDIVERYFDPFYTVKPIGLGTGLGLARIHEFTRKSGLQMKFESAIGRGTTVSLYLPRQ
jgi:signal transduction histidine kinase